MLHIILKVYKSVGIFRVSVGQEFLIKTCKRVNTFSEYQRYRGSSEFDEAWLNFSVMGEVYKLLIKF